MAACARAWHLRVILARKVARGGVGTTGLGEICAETGHADVEKEVLDVLRLRSDIIEPRKTVEELEGPPSEACPSSFFIGR